MRIFFCERCNKRLTDDDVAKGRAVDKKFNGVYCKGCDPGVPVLETWSLPQHQKQAPQSHGPTAQTVPAARRSTPQAGQVATATPPPGVQLPHTTTQAPAAPRRVVYGRNSTTAAPRGASHGHHGGHDRSGRAGHHEEGGYIKPSQSQRKPPQPLSVKMCAALAVVVFIIGAVILFASGGKGPGAVKKNTTESSSSVDSSSHHLDANSLEKNADIAYEKLVLEWRSLSDVARLERGENFLREYGDTEKAAKVRLLVNDLKKSR